MTPGSTDSARQTLEAHIDLIEQVVEWTCRRQRFSREDAEDFRSNVFLKLIQNDYAVLRKFRGKSSLRTYLTTVIQRLALDFRNQKWGKWRPSAAARRLGSVALHLETLVWRDRLTLDEAIATLLTNYRVESSRDELEQISKQLPVRHSRRENVDLPIDLSAKERADAALWRKEDLRRKVNAGRRLHSLLAALPTEDRLILKLRFEDGLKICQIAARLELKPRPLYRRIQNCLSGLRHRLESDGFTREQYV